MPIIRSGTYYDTLQDYYGLGEESDKNKKSKQLRANLGLMVDLAKGGMPPRNKKNFRSTEAGAGMTQAGVKAYRTVSYTHLTLPTKA